MTNPEPLTDVAALARNRTRADLSALFLQQTAADDIQDRLSMVNKAFKAAAIVTPFPAVWENRLENAVITAEADTLTLQPLAHDLVIHSMGLHWASDPVGQIIQCRNALKPDGLLIMSCLGGQTLHELRACLAQAESSVTGGLSPRVAPMGEIRDLGGLLQRAGLALPVADSTELTAHYKDAWHLMRDLRAMGEANALKQRIRHTTRPSILRQAAALYADHFASQNGRVTATFEIVTLTGWSPSDSQPKPLRPGSAQHRLADALRTDETPLND